MKISFQITAGAVWLDTVQHRPVNCSQPASQEVTEYIMSKVHRAVNLQKWRVMGKESWWINDRRWSSVRQLASEMTHWLHHHRKQALDGKHLLPFLCLSYWVPGNVVCGFSGRWKWKGETENLVCVSGLPVVQLTAYEIGQQMHINQSLGVRDIPFLLLQWR